MDVLIVSILCENGEGKSYAFREECDSMITVASMFIKFKPKRGYKPVSYNVEVARTLV